MKLFKILLVLATSLLLAANATYGWVNWLTLKTRHFTVFYKPGHESEAKEALQTLEYYRPEVERLCGNEEFHLSFVVDGSTTESDSYTTPIYSRIYLSRYIPNGIAGIENWWSVVGVHEYTHELSLSKTSGIPGKLNRVLGKNFLFMPNLMIPGWIIEGVAVYQESRITPYQGRLNDGLYDAYIGARVKDGRFPTILDATFMPAEYQQDSLYTYGGAFIDYLTRTYGEAKLTRFFEVNSGKIGAILATPSFSCDQSARQVFGKGFPQLWADWQQYETKRFQNYAYDGKPLTNHECYIQNLATHQGKLYYQSSYPVKTGAFTQYTFNQLVERDLKTGTCQTLVSTTGTFLSNFRALNGKLYYMINKFTPVLYQYDLATHEKRKLIRDEIRTFEVEEDGNVLFSKSLEKGFGSELYRFDSKTRKKQLLLSSDYSIDDIVSDGKRLVVSARRDWEGNNLYLLNIDKQEFIPLIQTAYGERGMMIRGDRLFFTANYQQMNAVYCYNFTTKQVSRITRNGWVGNFSYDEATNQLYFTQLNSYGMDLYQKTAEFQEFTLPSDPATVKPDFTLSDNEIKHGKYRDNLKTLVPKSWYPLIKSDKHEYGATFSGGDAVMNFPMYTGLVLYNTKEQEWLGGLEMPVLFLAPLMATVSWEKTKDEQTKELMLFLPLGEQTMIGTTFNYEKDYKGAEISPFIQLGFQLPKTSFTVSARTPRSTLKNDQKRSGVYGDAEIKQYLPGSELRLAAQYIDDPDNPDNDLFEEIRGYSNRLDAKYGKTFTLEYSRPLFKIRNGLWNPSLFFEDVSGTLFYDRAVAEKGPRQSSWGLELHLETKLMYGSFPLDLGARIARNREEKNTYEIFFKTVMQEGDDDDD